MRELALFPIFLGLENRPCLVVGGGAVAARKCESLLAAGARVRLVAPDISAEVKAVSSCAGSALEIVKRPYESRDQDGIRLVIAATDDPELNRRVRDDAEGRSTWVNVVDSPGLCTFHVPALVSRGDLQIAVSTNGKSPLLAQWIRRRLEALFPEDWRRYVDWLGEARRRLQARGGREHTQRAEAMRELINDESMELLLSGREAEFRNRMDQWLASVDS